MNDFQIIREALDRIEQAMNEEPDIIIGKTDPMFTGAMAINDTAVKLKWKPFEGDFDIEYGDKYQYSVKKSTGQLIPGSPGEFRIGGLTKGTWNFRKKTSSLLPIKYVGFWDADFGAPELTVGKTMSVDNLSKVNGTVIPHVGGFSHDKPVEWLKRCDAKNIVLSKHKERILFANLLDEPIGPWNATQLEKLSTTAWNTFVVPVGYTFKKLTINDPDRPLPQNIDYAGINYYTFRNDQWAYDTKAKYLEHLRFTVDNARKRLNPNTEIFITGQAFYGADSQKYAKPHEDSPYWLQEGCNELGIDIVLWWLWKGAHGYTACEDMPDLLENIRKTT